MKPNSALEIVKNFYDTYGWKKDAASGRYLAEILHEDLEETTQRYMESNEARYKKFFGESGCFFLDAGCGGEPRTELSRNFQNHVCVDISLVGLQGARKRLGDFGFYVVADLSALPFKDESFDGVLASHVLYHVDKERQRPVLRDLYRVTKTNKSILVFYSSQYNLISLIHAGVKPLIQLTRFLWKLLARNGKGLKSGPNTPPLYSHTHNPIRLAKEFSSTDVTCLRTLTKSDTERLRRLHLLTFVVPILSFLERTFPHAMVYVGQYVAIRIHKND